MKTREIKVDIQKNLTDLRRVSGSLPSPYFVPVKILVSEDEINEVISLSFIYFNKEQEVEAVSGQLSLRIGKMSQKIQKITSSRNLGIKGILSEVEKSNLVMKEIIAFVIKTYLSPG